MNSDFIEIHRWIFRRSEIAAVVIDEFVGDCCITVHLKSGTFLQCEPCADYESASRALSDIKKELM